MQFSDSELAHILAVVEEIPIESWSCEREEDRYSLKKAYTFAAATPGGAAVDIKYEPEPSYDQTYTLYIDKELVHVVRLADDGKLDRRLRAVTARLFGYFAEYSDIQGRENLTLTAEEAARKKRELLEKFSASPVVE
jgi:hypothetical protein